MHQILVIDDSEQDASLIAACLESSGIKDIQIRLNGRDGLALCATDSVRIVILDTVLPGENGFEVCRNIKALKNAPKIIMVTGFIDAVDAVKAREYGADDYVVKTQDMSLIAAAVKKALHLPNRQKA